MEDRTCQFPVPVLLLYFVDTCSSSPFELTFALLRHSETQTQIAVIFYLGEITNSLLQSLALHTSQQFRVAL